MLTIYEGPDCVGKTTMAKKAATSEGTYIHWGNHIVEDKISHDSLWSRVMALKDWQVHCDRSPIGEYIYAKYRNGDCRFSRKDIGWLVHQPGVQIVFVTAELDTLQKLASILEAEWICNRYTQIYDDYTRLYADFARYPNVHLIDNTAVLRTVLEDYISDYNARLRDIANNDAALAAETCRSSIESEWGTK